MGHKIDRWFDPPLLSGSPGAFQVANVTSVARHTKQNILMAILKGYCVGTEKEIILRTNEKSRNFDLMQVKLQVKLFYKRFRRFKTGHVSCNVSNPNKSPILAQSVSQLLLWLGHHSIVLLIVGESLLDETQADHQIVKAKNTVGYELFHARVVKHGANSDTRIQTTPRARPRGIESQERRAKTDPNANQSSRLVSLLV